MTDRHGLRDLGQGRGAGPPRHRDQGRRRGRGVGLAPRHYRDL